MIAIFTLNDYRHLDRRDGKEALGKDGGVGVVGMKKLEQIDIYSKPEWLSRSSGVVPVPIKTIHFEYNYTLCQGTPDNNSLTTDGKVN